MGTTSPSYKLDVRSSFAESKVHLSGTNSDDGGYLGSSTSNSLFLGGGASYDGTNWVAKSTSAAVIHLNSGSLSFSSNTGLVSGNSFTPTERLKIDGNSGNVNVMVGKFTQYNNITLEGMGLSVIVDTIEKTNQNVNIGATTFNNSSNNGLYKVVYYLACSTADASGANVVLNIAWNDGYSKTKTSSSVSFSSTIYHCINKATLTKCAKIPFNLRRIALNTSEG
jgi:hypothetical protein